jgi:hypothetical protein
MKTRLLVIALALTLVSACSAFDSGEGDLGNGQSFITPDMIAGFDNGLAGDYVGKMTLEENGCAELDVEVGEKVNFAVNVIQSGNLVSFGFVDESEASGILDENNEAVIVKRGLASIEVFNVAFSDDGMIFGECEYMEHAIGEHKPKEACARYALELTKE